ncbi:MAG: hypothetical protein GYA17_07500, partial [Chloroflexi bacterium]|nr:hypothetical protein [Chloroflexota bacterium]
ATVWIVLHLGASLPALALLAVSILAGAFVYGVALLIQQYQLILEFGQTVHTVLVGGRQS